MDIVLAIDNDIDASRTFQTNFPNARVYAVDIRQLPTRSLEAAVLSSGNNPILFSACAPCQPFSRQRGLTSGHGDKRMGLLGQFLRFVKRYRPELLFVENVPGLATGILPQRTFDRFIQTVKRLGYSSEWHVVRAQCFGVPQRRARLILLASRLGPIGFPTPTHGPGSVTPRYTTVRECIGDFPPIAAGTQHPTVANHRAAAVSPLNMQRLKVTPPGGSWTDWPSHLVPNCHKEGAGGYTDAYGRMHWDSPTTALTTRCISYSNGRFGHPDQNRAISVREAATLQTFPMSFTFDGNLNSQARQIGNAVPVMLAQRFGEHLSNHVVAIVGDANRPH